MVWSKLCLIVLVCFWGISAQCQGRLLVFYDTECPICQKTTKRLQEMYDKYGQNVAFTAVFSTKSLKKSEVRTFAKEYQFTLPYVIDRKHKLVERYDVRTTPEVVLLNAQDQEVYRGAVDNQFFGLGKYRPKTTEFYLQSALEALTSGKPISPARTEPVGCLINRRKSD